MNKPQMIEFIVMITWSIVMVGLSIYSVLHGKDVSMGLSTAYVGALGAYAIKQTWGN